MRFFSTPASVPALEPTHPPVQAVPGLKRPGREADHSHPSSAEVKNGGAIPPLPHISTVTIVPCAVTHHACDAVKTYWLLHSQCLLLHLYWHVFTNHHTQPYICLKAAFAFLRFENLRQNSRPSALKTKPDCFADTKCLHPSSLRAWDRLIFGNQIFWRFEDSDRLLSSVWFKFKIEVVVNFYTDCYALKAYVQVDVFYVGVFNFWK
jgi:hypothetical protein